MIDKLEILKASVPFATITGVVVGALLNSRLSRKDKMRDHLFSYKVKAYSTIAESIIEIKRDFLAIRTNLLLQRDPEGKKAVEIWEYFNKVRAEQALFISNKTRHNFFLLEEHIYVVVEKAIFWDLNPSKESVGEMMSIYENIGLQCDIFIERIQKELGISKL